MTIVTFTSIFVLTLAAGEYLIYRYFREKENFVERLNAKLKGSSNAQE